MQIRKNKLARLCYLVHKGFVGLTGDLKNIFVSLRLIDSGLDL